MIRFWPQSDRTDRVRPSAGRYGTLPSSLGRRAPRNPLGAIVFTTVTLRPALPGFPRSGSWGRKGGEDRRRSTTAVRSGRGCRAPTRAEPQRQRRDRQDLIRHKGCTLGNPVRRAMTASRQGSAGTPSAAWSPTLPARLAALPPRSRLFRRAADSPAVPDSGCRGRPRVGRPEGRRSQRLLRSSASQIAVDSRAPSDRASAQWRTHAVRFSGPPRA